ncbi:MAG: NAD(P)/FAD-dependent oxidoreductase, partial [Actinobacteria bacterium]|nr:NAD(P)/FAD-dependent oxidoreductase [Actinomycetota bacterium]
MTKRIVILGGGTGGTLTANRLHRHFRHHGSQHQPVEITVVDQDDHHVYQPGLLFVPFGLANHSEIVRPRQAQLHRDIEFVQDLIDHVDIHADTVYLQGGRELPYDVLVVATGAILAFDETEGLTGPGWNEKVFTFYDVAGATGLAAALDNFEGGKLVVNVVDMPIKCPVAPLEFCFLADWYFTDRGMRDKVEITYATPLDGAFTKPVASAALASLLEEKGIHLVTEFNTGEVAMNDDGAGGKLIGYDGR